MTKCNHHRVPYGDLQRQGTSMASHPPLSSLATDSLVPINKATILECPLVIVEMQGKTTVSLSVPCSMASLSAPCTIDSSAPHTMNPPCSVMDSSVHVIMESLSPVKATTIGCPLAVV